MAGRERLRSSGASLELSAASRADRAAAGICCFDRASLFSNQLAVGTDQMINSDLSGRSVHLLS
jgi:hypothetical protein